jgi:20S proteasome subunit alpha 4
MTRHIAGIQQKYTQSGGVRPFGISTLVAGLGTDGAPALHQTDPSGTHSRWSAAAIGRNAKTVREFLEKEHDKSIAREGPAKLAVRALMEAVEAGSATVELAELRAPPPAPATPPGGAPAGPPPNTTTDPPRAVLRFLSAEEVDALVAEVEADKAAADAARKAGGGGGGGGGAGEGGSS